MAKYKVLVIPSDKTGVGYYRSTTPHLKLQELYPDTFRVDIDESPDFSNENYFKGYDLIHFHGTLGPWEEFNKTIDMIKKLNIPTIMDIDDHWSPGRHHPAYEIIKREKLPEKLINNLKNSPYVATTTEIFKDELSKFNKNIFVIPNAIDTDEEQYQPKEVKSERIRIGWLGGSSHLEDLKLLRGLVSKLKSDGLIDKVQFVVCGFDLRGKMTIFDKNTGEQKVRDILPRESVWYKYEQIFTDNYKIVSPKYKRFLERFKNKEYDDIENEPYRRVWTKPITSYANNYNLFDISLAPLVENDFNKVKSQLKVIESGFHKKALIAQDFGPYKIDLENMYEKSQGKSVPAIYNDTGNALLVDSTRNHKQWYQFIKKLIQEPERIKLLGDNLYNSVKDKYSMEAVCKLRKDIYLDLIKKHQEKGVENEVENV
jgi:glycosyltransferase involved in cell wall biosynthesis